MVVGLLVDKIISPAQAGYKRYTYDPAPEHTVIPVLAATSGARTTNQLSCHRGHLFGIIVA